MWLGFQLSCAWISIQLVSIVSATTESTCDMMRFKQARSETGDVLCATSPSPTATVNMKTKDQCSWACAHSGDTCATGFNFKHQETLCEMFASPATALELQQHCEHYAVCTSLRHFCVVFRIIINFISPTNDGEHKTHLLHLRIWAI